MTESKTSLINCFRNNQEFYRFTIDDNGEKVLNEDEVRILAKVGMYRDIGWTLQKGNPTRSKAIKRMIELKQTLEYQQAEHKYFSSFDEDIK